MARMETMMEALLQERSMTMTPGGSVERDEFDNNDTLPMPYLDPINPALALLDKQAPTNSPQEGPASAIDPNLGTGTPTVRYGDRDLTFPTLHVYQSYIDTFFRELQYFCPCVHEGLFRVRSKQVLTLPEIPPDDACFLTLNYTIFALNEVTSVIKTPEPHGRLPGWHWLQLADDVAGRRQLYGEGDLSLAQTLLLKVSAIPLTKTSLTEKGTLLLAGGSTESGVQHDRTRQSLRSPATYELSRFLYRNATVGRLRAYLRLLERSDLRSAYILIL